MGRRQAMIEHDARSIDIMAYLLLHLRARKEY
jgi:hypothetical protein